jgi:hypothetical protein
MSHITAATADFEISRAERQAAELHPRDAQARLAFEVGMLRGLVRQMASQAAIAAQADQISSHIMRADINADTALEIVQAVNASLCHQYQEADPDGLSPAIDALEFAEANPGGGLKALVFVRPLNAD